MFVVAIPYSQTDYGFKTFFFFLSFFFFFCRRFYIDVILFLSFLLFVFVEVTQLAIYQWAGVCCHKGRRWSQAHQRLASCHILQRLLHSMARNKVRKTRCYFRTVDMTLSTLGLEMPRGI